MSYFHMNPHVIGWTTSKVMSILPEDMLMPRDMRHLGYKSKNAIHDVTGAVYALALEKFKSDKGAKIGFRNRVKRYHEKLMEIEPADVVILTTTDTVASKPPYTLRKLAADHPANSCTQFYARTLKQLRKKKGKTGYVAVIDPPFMPVVMTDRWEVHPELAGEYFSHGFIHWNDTDAQERVHKRRMHRAEAFRRAYDEFYPDWNREFPVGEWYESVESRLQRAIRGVIVEKTVDFLAEKCNENFFAIIPNYSIMKDVKSGIIGGVREAKPSIMHKEKLVDVVAPFLSNETYKRDLTCSVSVKNKMRTYLENIYHVKLDKDVSKPRASSRINTNRFARKCPDGKILCEWTPGSGTHCFHRDEKKKCMQHALDEVLSEYSEEAQEKIREFLTERRIHIPSVDTVIKELSFDLYDDLKPVKLPVNPGVKREDAETSCSSVSGAYNTVEFFLRNQGYLDVPPEVRFLGVVGTVCHETMYHGAPRSWKRGMEKNGIISLSMLYDEEPTTIHMQPDIAAFFGDRKLIIIDTKSGPVFYEKWLARKSHSRQIAGYSWYTEESLNRELEGVYGVVLHLQDFQTGEPITIPFRADQNSPARREFFHRTRSMVAHKRKWERDPEQFIRDFETNKYYGFGNTKDAPRINYALPAVIEFADDNGLDVKYRDFLEKVRRASKI